MATLAFNEFLLLFCYFIIYIRFYSTLMLWNNYASFNSATESVNCNNKAFNSNLKSFNVTISFANV